MLKKRTRRILAIVILVTIASPRDPLIKLLITMPIFQMLLMDYDEFSLNKLRKMRN